MKNLPKNRKYSLLFRLVAVFVILSFSSSLIILPPKAQAQSVSASPLGGLNLPAPGVMVTSSAGFVPPMLKGMKVGLRDPFAFDFILDSGNADLTQGELKQEANKLIKYFLASLTIPEDDLWVNLSPYEKNRIIPESFGQTEMGRDLLAQDYILKQLTASLIYPEEDLGKEFWDRIYAKARQLYDTQEIPINTFNKVWILPDKAVVYEDETMAFVLESRLRVMLDEDYVAMSHQSNISESRVSATEHSTKPLRGSSIPGSVASQIIKEIIVPEIEKEVNNGQNFATLRQVYHSLILAKWYKQNLKQSILNREYSDQKKIAGIDINGVEATGQSSVQYIYEQYLEAFKKGVFDYIKEDYDMATQQIIPRKYFSGGLEFRVPLEAETDPEQLARADIVGKLSWIKGIYRQARVSARYINGLFGKEIREGRAQKIDPIEYEGTETTTYEIPVSLKEAGQYGYIGLGEKEIRDGEVDSDVVVYLIKEAANNPIVRDYEGFKAQRIREKMLSLGEEQNLDRRLTASEMRLWIRENVNGVAGVFLREIDREAESRHPLESFYSKAKKENRLPSDEFIAETYTRAEDFRDLNLASSPVENRVNHGVKRTVTKDDLRKVPLNVLQNTSTIFENMFLFVKRLENPNSYIRVRGIDWLGLLMEKGIVDEKIIKEMQFVEKLVKVLGDGDYDVRVAAAHALGNGVSQGGDLAGEIIMKLVKALGDGNNDVQAAAAQALGNALEKGVDIGKEGIKGLMKAFEDENFYVQVGAAHALGNGISQGGDLAGEVIMKLVKALGDGNNDVQAAAAQALGNALEKGVDIGKEGIKGLMKSLGSEFLNVQAAAAEALGNGVSQWGELAKEITRALVTTLGDGNNNVQVMATTAAAQALGNALEKGVDIGKEGIKGLMRVFGSKFLDVQVAVAEALGKGMQQEGELAREIIPALVIALEDQFAKIQAAAAQALGNALEKGVDIGKEGIKGLMKSLGSEFLDVQVAAAEALGKGMQQEGKLARKITRALVTVLGGKNPDVRAAAAWLSETDILREIIPEFVKIVGSEYTRGRVGAAHALGNGVSQGGDLAGEIIMKLVKALGDKDPDVRAAAAQALGKSVSQWGELAEGIIMKLVKALGDKDPDVRAAAAQALGNALGKEKLQILSMKDISDCCLLLQEERKSQRKVLQDDGMNSRQVLILKIHSIIEGKVDPDDVKYVGQIADVTENEDALGVTLDVIRDWAVGGSSDAQTFLEGRVGQIVSRNPESDEGYVKITDRDNLYIEATAGSFRQRSLLPIFAERKFDPASRVKVIRLLAGIGYIDSDYANIKHDQIDEYLNMISEVYEKLKMSPSRISKVLIDGLIRGEVTVEQLSEARPKLETIIARKDYRVLLGELLKDRRVMLAYYMMYHSRFQYQGTDPISYERFAQILERAGDSLRHENESVLKKDLVVAAKESGMSQQHAEEIAQSLLQGNVPLPYDSEFRYQGTVEERDLEDLVVDPTGIITQLKRRGFLVGDQNAVTDNIDSLTEIEGLEAEAVVLVRRRLKTIRSQKGDFIPQEVNILNEVAVMTGAQEYEISFQGARDYIVQILRINYLMQGIAKRLKKMDDSAAAEKEYGRIVNELKSGPAIFESVTVQLLALNDEIYTQQSRPRSEILEEQIQNVTGKVARANPAYQKLLETTVKKGSENGKFRLEGLEISGVMPVMEGVVTGWREQKKKALGKGASGEHGAQNKRKRWETLGQAEKRVYEAEEIDARVSLEALFSKFAESAKLKEGNPLYSVYWEMVGDLSSSYSGYEKGITSSTATRGRFLGSLYLDAVQKSNLEEAMRFSDGAHCCNSSDPKKAREYGGEGLYTAEMHRWLTDATTFFFQVSTEEGDGKQVGWLKAWAGIDEQKKLFVGSNFLYLAPKYQVPEIAEALLARIEKVLFSIPISKYAQADIGKPTNAVLPPAAYKKGSLKVMRLQSLMDGKTIQADVRFPGNKMVKQNFRVKERSGDQALLEHAASSPVQESPGGIDFNLDLLELENQGQGRDFNLPDIDRNFDYIRIDNGLLPVIINITPIQSLPAILGQIEDEEQQHEQQELSLVR